MKSPLRVVRMDKNKDQQEDWAFERLDELLDNAGWQSGMITLKPGKNTIYCYDMEGLFRELLSLGEQVVYNKFKSVDANVEEVVRNLIDEYQGELTHYNITRRTRSPVKTSLTR